MISKTTRLFVFTLAAACALAGSAVAQNKPAPAKPLPVDSRHLAVLVKTTVIAVNQANLTNNYSVLHALAAPGFQKKNSAKDLEKIFAKLRATKLDFSPIVIYDPRFSRPPEILPNGMLRLTGFFPTQPLMVQFELVFQPVNGEWRLFGVGLTPKSANQTQATQIR